MFSILSCVSVPFMILTAILPSVQLSIEIAITMGAATGTILGITAAFAITTATMVWMKSVEKLKEE